MSLLGCSVNESHEVSDTTMIVFVDFLRSWRTTRQRVGLTTRLHCRPLFLCEGRGPVLFFSSQTMLCALASRR